MEYAVQDPAINTARYLLGRPCLERSIKHYSNSHQILLVGEGDFSFSLTLANAFGSAENMVPTSLDSREKVLQLYDSAHETLSNLERLGATLLHGVDATTMEKHHMIRKMRFHRIVYNLPHAGFYGKEDDEKVIKKHRHLLKMFFKNARSLLTKSGEIHVTHKENGPYEKWELVKQAEECGLLLKGSVRFRITDYPGYTNRRGAGPNAGDSFCLGKCQTYKFVLGPDILYEWESLAIQVISPNVSSEASTENSGAVLWEPEPERQMRMGTDMAVLWEPEPERQMRMPGEMADLWEPEPARHWKSGPERQMTMAGDMEVLWEPEPERQMRMAGEMVKAEEINKSDEFAKERNDILNQNAQAWRVKIKSAEQLDETSKLKDDAIKKLETSLVGAILELESERQTRKAAETAKADLDTLLNDLKVILNKELEKNYELKCQRDWNFRLWEEVCREYRNIAKRLDEAYAERNDALHQKAEAWREKEKIAKQLAEVLRLNEAAAKQATILKEAMSELDFERQARKSAEAAKTDLETAFNHMWVSLNKEHRNNHELKRQRDEALCQKEEACREKTVIVKELDETLRLVKIAVEQRGEFLWQQKGPSDQKNKISFGTIISSGLAFALYLFRKCRARIKGVSENELDSKRDALLV